MPRCPQCRMPLTTVRQREGIFFRCPGCDGRAVTLPQIRRAAGDRVATSLLRQINRAPATSDRPCPFCTAPMRSIHSEAPALELDSCRPCGVVWFDPQEFEQLPAGALESTDALQLRGIEAMAVRKLEQQRRDYEGGDAPDLDWKTVPAFFGFPVESETDPLSRWPWVTWSLALVIAGLSLWAFFDLRGAIDRFGLVPAEFGRLGGLTLLTSFFLHGDAMHLIGNLYFLLIFGDNVEDMLGRWRYAMLILAAALVGDAVHILADPHSTVPCIGASGGISGVIVFYALQFPRARLGILFRYWLYFRWLQFPAWAALVFWLLLQTVGVVLQLGGFSNVAATAHLGGAAVGFALWLGWRRQEKRPLLDA